MLVKVWWEREREKVHKLIGECFMGDFGKLQAIMLIEIVL